MRVALVAAIVLTLASGAGAAPDPSLFRALEGGGFVVVLRHAATDQRQTDATPVELGDCATQRNLTARGRSAARALGAAFRARGLVVGRILASPYCRTLQTARLAFGRAMPSATLLVWSAVSRAAIDRHVERFGRLVARRPAEGTLTVLVTHRDLVARGLGVELGEGDAAIMAPRGSGRFALVGVVKPAEWRPA